MGGVHEYQPPHAVQETVTGMPSEVTRDTMDPAWYTYSPMGEAAAPYSTAESNVYPVAGAYSAEIPAYIYSTPSTSYQPAPVYSTQAVPSNQLSITSYEVPTTSATHNQAPTRTTRSTRKRHSPDCPHSTARTAPTTRYSSTKQSGHSRSCQVTAPNSPLLNPRAAVDGRGNRRITFGEVDPEMVDELAGIPRDARRTAMRFPIRGIETNDTLPPVGGRGSRRLLSMALAGEFRETEAGVQQLLRCLSIYFHRKWDKKK